MAILDIHSTTYTDLLLHLALFLATALAAVYMIQRFFFTASYAEQDMFYLRGQVTKMVTLAGQPRHVGGKYYIYRFMLMDDQVALGADMQKVALSFEYVSDQDVSYDPRHSGRYPVEDFGTKGYFEVIEKEGSDIDKILRRNVGREEPFQLSVKGPYGSLKYVGHGTWYK